MTSPFTLGLNQVATYWAPGSPDGLGRLSFDTPVAISCRWEDRITQFRSPQGELLTSQSVVYVDRVLAFKGMLVLGDYTAETTVPDKLTIDGVDGPREIRGKNASPSLGVDLILHKVYL